MGHGWEAAACHPVFDLLLLVRYVLDFVRQVICVPRFIDQDLQLCLLYFFSLASLVAWLRAWVCRLAVLGGAWLLVLASPAARLGAWFGLLLSSVLVFLLFWKINCLG